ncbi:hypothetical protein BGZ83_010846 [Gryganskiella cystojenkinii]|nr:hypothetical protein BGZ83_010846 [Gryganskiella cystojenkinii]
MDPNKVPGTQRLMTEDGSLRQARLTTRDNNISKAKLSLWINISLCRHGTRTMSINKCIHLAMGRSIIMPCQPRHIQLPYKHPPEDRNQSFGDSQVSQTGYVDTGQPSWAMDERREYRTRCSQVKVTLHGSSIKSNNFNNIKTRYNKIGRMSNSTTVSYNKHLTLITDDGDKAVPLINVWN